MCPRAYGAIRPVTAADAILHHFRRTAIFHCAKYDAFLRDDTNSRACNDCLHKRVPHPFKITYRKIARHDLVFSVQNVWPRCNFCDKPLVAVSPYISCTQCFRTYFRFAVALADTGEDVIEDYEDPTIIRIHEMAQT